MDILKLNFDGNYIRGEPRGSIGGVIRGYDRAIIRNYSGLVDVSDATKLRYTFYWLAVGN